MNHHRRRPPPLPLTLAAYTLALTAPGGAHAAEPSPEGGSAAYQCLGKYDAQAAATPVTFALLSQPTSARPGDTLSLSGTLGVTLSDADAQKSRLLLAQKASVDATDFNLVVKLGSKRVSLRPSSVVSTPAPIKTPFTLTADVSYPALTIPASATGAVTVEMPSARKTSTKVPGAPGEVSFTAHLKQDSPLAPGRDYACWTDDDLGAEAIIARIPLTAPPGPDGPPSPPAPEPDSPAPPGDVPGADAPPPPAGLPDPSASTAGPPATAPVDTSTSPTSTSPTLTSTTLADAPIPAATVSDDTYIPGWILALLIAICPAAAIAYAAVLRKRLQHLSVKTRASRRSRLTQIGASPR